MKTSNATANRTVKRAFDLINQIFYSKSRNYAADLLKQCAAEEKDHRGCGFGSDFTQHHPDACTVTEAAKMFAVKRIAEYLNTPADKLPRGAHFLDMQKSCFWAAGIADEYAEEIRNAWTAQNISDLADLDYLHFVKPSDAPALTQSANYAAKRITA